MSKKSRDNDLNKPRAQSPHKHEGKQEPAHEPRPHWPTGLRLLPAKDITCFIPEHLAVIVSREAFEQLFAYAYSTTTYIALSGNVRRTLASVLAREAWPVALPLASNTVALLRFRLAMVTVTLARTTCQGARP